MIAISLKQSDILSFFLSLPLSHLLRLYHTLLHSSSLTLSSLPHPPQTILSPSHFFSPFLNHFLPLSLTLSSFSHTSSLFSNSPPSLTLPPFSQTLLPLSHFLPFLKLSSLSHSSSLPHTLFSLSLSSSLSSFSSSLSLKLSSLTHTLLPHLPLPPSH